MEMYLKMSINCLNSIGKFLYSVGGFIASPFIALIQKIQSLFANIIGNNSATRRAVPTIKGRAGHCAAPSELRSAARVNNLEGVRALLSKGNISEANRELAVTDAAKNGHAACIEALIDGCVNAEELRGWAVRAAAEHGRAACIEALINGRVNAEELRGWAVIKAAQYNQADCIKALIDGRVNAEELRGQAVINAAQYNQADCITSLLASGAVISEAHRGEAVRAAAKHGHAACITALLANGAISEADRGLAFRNTVLSALEARNPYQYNPSRPYDEDESREYKKLGKALSDRYLGCFDALLPPGTVISTKMRDGLLGDTAR